MTSQNYKDYHDNIEWYYGHREEYRIPLECYSCEFEDAMCEVYRQNFPLRYAWLCDVCASSLAGSAYWYPKQFDQKIMAHISFCTNIILETINKKDE